MADVEARLAEIERPKPCKHAWRLVGHVGQKPAYRCSKCRQEKHD